MHDDVVADLGLLQLEADVRLALSSAGFPDDLTRLPTPAEIASRTNFAGIEDDVAQAASEISTAARAGRDRMIGLIGQYLTRALTVYDLIGLTDDLAAALLVLPGTREIVADVAAEANARMLQLVESSATRLVQDAIAGGIRAAVGPPLLTPGMVTSVAAQANRVGSESVVSAIRAVRGAAYTTPRDVGVASFHDIVTSSAYDASVRGLDDVAAQGALHANGVGRRAALGSLTGPVKLYASELLDRNTCKPCSFIDGTEYPDQAAADRDYPTGRYKDCEGGDRCRGTVVAVADTESPATLIVPGTKSRRRQQAPARR